MQVAMRIKHRAKSDIAQTDLAVSCRLLPNACFRNAACERALAIKHRVAASLFSRTYDGADSRDECIDTVPPRRPPNRNLFTRSSVDTALEIFHS